MRYNAYGPRLRVSKRALATPTPTPTPNPNPNWQSWATLKRIPITFKSGSVQGKSVEYPVLLDDKGEPNVEMGNAFLVWLKDQPELPKVDPLKFAQKFLTASANMERKKRNMPRIDEGCFNSYMEVRVAAKEQRRAAGAASTTACKDQSTRADHLPTFDEKFKMMHLSYSGDAHIHPNPLRAMQTGVELLLTHTTGVRGEKVRSGTYAHVFPRPYADLAGGEGIMGTVFHNTRQGKTNVEGEASHAGWLPSKNPLLDIDGGLGTCLLYRFLATGEQIPSVTASLDGNYPGYRYKWLPLIKTTDGCYPLDTANALLSIRPIDQQPQNAAWNMLFHEARVPLYKGDSVTHGGRAACQQEFREAGGDPRVSDEALGYTHDVSKDHYSPHIPIQFGLQRGHYGLLSPENFAEADAAHLRAARHAAKEPLNSLVDLAVPELRREEELVESINTVASDPYSRKAVMQQKAANVETHKREHQNFLSIARHQLSMAILNAASRPRKRDGTIDYDSKSLFEEHKKSPVYQAMRIRADDSLLFDHPLFARIAAAVKAEEERERSLIVASGSRQKTASTAATMVVGALAPQLDRMEKKMDANASSLVDTAATAAAAADAASAATSTALAIQETTMEREIRRYDLGEGDAQLSPRTREARLTEAARGCRSIYSYSCLNLPSPPPPAASTVTSLQSEAPTSIVTTPSTVLPSAPLPVRKRKRRADDPGLPHSDLTTLGSIEALWTEYTDRLRQREESNPEWKGTGPDNKRSRQLWTDKLFFYREIARQVEEGGRNVREALAAVQQRLDDHKKARQGGWKRLLDELQKEQTKGPVRDGLTALLKGMKL